MIYRGTLPVVTVPQYDTSTTGGTVVIPKPGGTSTVTPPATETRTETGTDLGDLTNLFAFPVKSKVSDTLGFQYGPIGTLEYKFGLFDDRDGGFFVGYRANGWTSRKARRAPGT